MPKAPVLHLRNDPITFEVLRHRLWQINDEQGRTIIRVSGSPVATEGNDFNVAIADANGALVAVGPYIVMHVAAITSIIQSTMELIGEENVRPGDMYLVNDSWMGAGHQNDFCVVQPVFWKKKRIAWTASVIHQVDVGGPVPGSWNFSASTTFEEAPRYKALRLVRDEIIQPEVIATVLTNSRLPDQVDLDLRAQIAAGNVARQRIHELVSRYGIKVVSNAIADQLDYAQALFKQKLLNIPDGSWYAQDYLDHDGHEERNYLVSCRIIKRGDKLRFDFSGTSRQAPGLINCTYAGAAAGAYSAVYAYLCAKIPWNSGVLRQIELIIEEGTIHNATFPAPVGYGVVHASWCTLNASALALGKMLASSAEPEEAMAGWAGSTFVYNIFGRDNAGKQFATMLLSSDLQGTGARSFGDGYDVGGKLNAPRAKVTNVESAEARYPLLYLYRRHTRDSGGAGRWRGGVSAEVALTAHGAPQIDFTVNTVGAGHSSSPGISGGYPGGGSTVMLVTKTELATHWAQGQSPQDVAKVGGDLTVLPSKARFVLRPGDVFVAIPHGGGGLGDPLLRDPDRVGRDVAEGNVSIEWAERIYGVVLDAEGEVSQTKTSLCREAIRRRRLGGATSTVQRHPIGVDGEALVSDGSRFHCAHCGAEIGSAKQDARVGLAFQLSDVGEGGPWLARRWQGQSPYMKLWQYCCPSCGNSISVEQHLASENSPWTESLARTLLNHAEKDQSRKSVPSVTNG